MKPIWKTTNVRFKVQANLAGDFVEIEGSVKYKSPDGLYYAVESFFHHTPYWVKREQILKEWQVDSPYERRKVPAEFKHPNRYKCDICHAEGNDKRMFTVECMYKVTESIPEAIQVNERIVNGANFFGAYCFNTCKTCRGEILTAMGEACNKRREARKYEKDSDGEIQYGPILKQGE